jgi:AraC-like DNA-binding protein
MAGAVQIKVWWAVRGSNLQPTDKKPGFRANMRQPRKHHATPRDSTTVTAEALNCGFWHLGEFSRAYKNCFGEFPSETLRRHD